MHDALAAVHREWMDLIETAIGAAVERGELAADPKLLAFDLNAYYEAANLASILLNDDDDVRPGASGRPGPAGVGGRRRYDAALVSREIAAPADR